MEVDFIKNFIKIIEDLKNEELLQKIQDTIDNVIAANSIVEISFIKNYRGTKFIT